MSKAAPTFVKAQPKGEINYPPYEEIDDTIAAAYDKFEVKPVGQIRECPKRIPYNSDKKTFQQKTGMDGFEGEMKLEMGSCNKANFSHSVSVHIQDA